MCYLFAWLVNNCWILGFHWNQFIQITLWPNAYEIIANLIFWDGLRLNEVLLDRTRVSRWFWNRLCGWCRRGWVGAGRLAYSYQVPKWYRTAPTDSSRQLLSNLPRSGTNPNWLITASRLNRGLSEGYGCISDVAFQSGTGAFLPILYSLIGCAK